jgi:hypothetical protein
MMDYEGKSARRKRINEQCRAAEKEITTVIDRLVELLEEMDAALTEVYVGPPEKDFNVTVSST